MGSTTTVRSFPDTQSAIVTMANGRSSGDASDYTAQILLQALFDLIPKVDIIPWAKKEAELARNFLNDKILHPWQKERRLSDHLRDPIIYVGEYRGFDNLFTDYICGAGPENLRYQTGGKVQ